MLKQESIKLLLMGPSINKNQPEIAGGAIVIFNELLKELDNYEIQYSVIDTNKKNYQGFLTAYLSIIKQVFFKQKGCTHISLHSSRDYMFFGLLVIFIGKMFNKKTSLRKFGGEALKTYTGSRGIKKYYLKFIFSNMDVLFLETKYLVEFFLKFNKHTFWFPNVRKRSLELSESRSYQKKFVFISHVIREKGIDEIIEASERLDDNYIIDIFGPIFDKKYSKGYFSRYGISYKGALQATDVIKKLNEYDVLLLPSYKEGYPGIILEAYSLGMPVITTTLPAIKEIVDPYTTGILVEPGSVDELVSAINYFDTTNYQYMSEHAYNKFDDFDSTCQTHKYLERL